MGKRLLFFLIGLLFLGLVAFVFVYFDDLLSRQQLVTEGAFVARTVFSDASGVFAEKRFFTFRLSNGQLVNIKEPDLPLVQLSQYVLGDKAKIYYRRGFFTKRIIYDSFYFNEGDKHN